jgi:hypothetical protein
MDLLKSEHWKLFRIKFLPALGLLPMNPAQHRQETDATFRGRASNL